MKKYLTIAITAFLLFAATIACAKPVDIKIKEGDIPVYELLNLCTLIESIEGNRITEEMWKGPELFYNDKAITCSGVNTKIIGTHTLKVEYNKQIYEFSIKVTDTEAPVIALTKESYEIFKDEVLDLSKDITVKDNFDFNPVMTIGNFDTSIVGEQTIKITASDMFGNTSEKEVKLVVKEAPVVDDPSGGGTNPGGGKKPGGNKPGGGGTPGGTCTITKPKDPMSWGDYKTKDAATAAAKSFLNTYRETLDLGSYSISSYNDSCGEIAGYTLYMKDRSGKFVKKP